MTEVLKSIDLVMSCLHAKPVTLVYEETVLKKDHSAHYVCIYIFL